MITEDLHYSPPHPQSAGGVCVRGRGGEGDDPDQEVTKDGDAFRAGNQGSSADDLGALAVSLP